MSVRVKRTDQLVFLSSLEQPSKAGAFVHVVYFYISFIQVSFLSSELKLDTEISLIWNLLSSSFSMVVITVF